MVIFQKGHKRLRILKDYSSSHRLFIEKWTQHGPDAPLHWHTEGVLSELTAEQIHDIGKKLTEYAKESVYGNPRES